MRHASPRLALAHAAFLAALAGAAGPAAAVPSFSRQTEMSCSACHTSFPQLTELGRVFKATGYTLTARRQVTDQQAGRDTLELARSAPLSAQIIAASTWVRSPGAGVRTGDVVLPDQLGLFYAGQIAPELGAFAQLTYEADADHLTIDNVDLRYAHELKPGGRSLVVGATLNNNPTVQDLWNTTPAWGWPFVTPGAWPGMGGNGALVDGALAQAVVGLSAYGFLDEAVYAEVGLYRSALVGVARPYTVSTPGLVDNAAPYWRVALQHDFGGHLVEVGAYGLHARIAPGFTTDAPPLPPPGGAGARDAYDDVALDAQWQHAGPIATALRGTWIHERRTLDASAPGERPTLDTVRLSGDATRGWLGVGAGLFRTTSSTSATFGAAGSAGTSGALAELTVTPWENTSFRAQYTRYTRLDGTSSGASGSNAFSLLAWLAF